MSDPNTSPVSLPAGSFDYDALKSGVDKAAKGAANKYDAGIKTVLTDARESVFASQDPRDIPGYKFVEVNNGLGGTEKVQVFDEKLAEAAEDDSTGAIPEAEARSNAARATAKAVDAADNTKE